MAKSPEYKIFLEDGKLKGDQPFDFSTWCLDFDLRVPNNKAYIVPGIVLGETACLYLEEKGTVKVV